MHRHRGGFVLGPRLVIRAPCGRVSPAEHKKEEPDSSGSSLAQDSGTTGAVRALLPGLLPCGVAAGDAAGGLG